MSENILSNKSNNPAAAATKKAESRLKKARDNNGKNQPAESPVNEVAKNNAELNKVLDELYSADNFRLLVRAPADVAMAITGDKVFDLPEKEVAAMASTGATAARYFTAGDPKYIALTMFLVTVATSYGSRSAVYFRNKRKRSKPQEAKKDEN